MLRVPLVAVAAEAAEAGTEHRLAFVISLPLATITLLGRAE